jgi:hypothetical protein
MLKEEPHYRVAPVLRLQLYSLAEPYGGGGTKGRDEDNHNGRVYKMIPLDQIIARHNQLQHVYGNEPQLWMCCIIFFFLCPRQLKAGAMLLNILISTTLTNMRGKCLFHLFSTPPLPNPNQTCQNQC